jgi:Fur family peroxide stress response transcriptional regulator
MKLEKSVIDRRVEGYREAARKAGVKLTHQRLEIFRTIASSLEHPDAEAVFKAIKKRMPTVSLDTVYRTLWLLKNLGMILTLGLRRETVRFDANLSRHHHFICERCGLMRDFESAEFDSIGIPKSAEGFGTVTETHIELRGLCRGCMKEKAEESAKTKPGESPGKARRRT